MDTEIERTIARNIEPLVAPNGAGGIAVAVRMDDRTLFFNYGLADQAGKRPITSDSLFNVASVRKVFEAAIVAQAVLDGEMKLDDPVAKYVGELRGDYIRRVTVGQLVTHTSGLLLPSDHPPWLPQPYSLAGFFDGQPQNGEAPGRQRIYTHAGYVLLQLVLERRYSTPIADLIDHRVIKPRHGFDNGPGPRRRRSRSAAAAAHGARGAGLCRGRPADRPARQPAEHVRFSRHRADVLVAARSRAATRRLSRR
jgi:beta-lactamase class C